MTDRPVTPVQEHCQQDWGHIQYGTLTGPTGQCVPNCPQCTIDRLRADLATARDALDVARRGHWRELADWLDLKFPDDPNPEVQRDLRALAEALDRIGEQ